MRRFRRRWKTVLRPLARRWVQLQEQRYWRAQQRAGLGPWGPLRPRLLRAWPHLQKLIHYRPRACRPCHRGNPSHTSRTL